MKKVKIFGNAFVITSNLSAADIELCKKHNPDALTLKDKDGKTYFSVSYNEGNPFIAKFANGGSGITFDGKTRNAEAKATFTGKIPAGTTNVAQYVATEIAGVASRLEEIEELVKAAAEKITADNKKLLDKIEVEDGDDKSNIQPDVGASENAGGENANEGE